MLEPYPIVYAVEHLLSVHLSTVPQLDIKSITGMLKIMSTQQLSLWFGIIYMKLTVWLSHQKSSQI